MSRSCKTLAKSVGATKRFVWISPLGFIVPSRKWWKVNSKSPIELGSAEKKSANPHMAGKQTARMLPATGARAAWQSLLWTAFASKLTPRSPSLDTKVSQKNMDRSTTEWFFAMVANDCWGKNGFSERSKSYLRVAALPVAMETSIARQLLGSMLLPLFAAKRSKWKEFQRDILQSESSGPCSSHSLHSPASPPEGPMSFLDRRNDLRSQSESRWVWSCWRNDTTHIQLYIITLAYIPLNW